MECKDLPFACEDLKLIYGDCRGSSGGYIRCAAGEADLTSPCPMPEEIVCCHLEEIIRQCLCGCCDTKEPFPVTDAGYLQSTSRLTTLKAGLSSQPTFDPSTRFPGLVDGSPPAVAPTSHPSRADPMIVLLSVCFSLTACWLLILGVLFVWRRNSRQRAHRRNNRITDRHSCNNVNLQLRLTDEDTGTEETI